MTSTLFFDTECYPNYFLLMFKLSDGRKKCFELDENSKLDLQYIRHLLKGTTTVGFNSRMYDIPMILSALRGKNNAELKKLSDRLISKEESSYDILCELGLWCPNDFDHIDLFKVAPKLPDLPNEKVGIKMYGARMHTPFLQGLPYDPSEPVTEEQKATLHNYCSNDIDQTMQLYNELSKPLFIRENINKEYNIDVRSKGDAGIAEVLMLKTLGLNKKKIKSLIPKKCGFKYELPSYIDFKSENLQELLYTISDINFNYKLVKDKDGEKKRQDNFKDGVPSNIKINGKNYSFGIGGLHSQENHRSIICKDNDLLVDIDVTGHYPKMIIDNKWTPDHLDQEKFSSIISKFYDDRVAAKKSGDKQKSDTYKIILNSIYGKFGDINSFLYSPKHMLHTTLTGQLSLLMLIEDLEEVGLEVVSANTDGILVYIKMSDYDLFKTICDEWQKTSNLNLEETRFKAIYSDSVNSYLAIKEDGSLKRKGSLFVEGDLAHNPPIKVCVDAVINYLLEGKPIEETILNCDTNPINFLMVKRVQGGGYWKEEYLGNVVRWYWSTEGEFILGKSTRVKKDGTPFKVPKVSDSDDAWPIMDLNAGLKNIHYNKYIAEAYDMLKRICIEVVSDSKVA